MMGSLLVRFPGRSIVWNAVGANFTVSPTWIVTWCGKKSLTSLPVFWNCFWAAVGSPASTVFVRRLRGGSRERRYQDKDHRPAQHRTNAPRHARSSL